MFNLKQKIDQPRKQTIGMDPSIHKRLDHEGGTPPTETGICWERNTPPYIQRPHTHSPRKAVVGFRHTRTFRHGVGMRHSLRFGHRSGLRHNAHYLGKVGLRHHMSRPIDALYDETPFIS